MFFGGPSLDTKPVIELYKKRFGQSIRVIDTDYKSAELIKYMCNTFFATKVGFLNEIYQIVEKLDLDWELILEALLPMVELVIRMFKFQVPMVNLVLGEHASQRM